MLHVQQCLVVHELDAFSSSFILLLIIDGPHQGDLCIQLVNHFIFCILLSVIKAAQS